MEYLTIKQTKELLGVSTDTIRRRIKAGEYIAEKRPGVYGDEWQLPSDQFQKATEIKDVIPVTRQISVAELQQGMQQAIANAVAKETAELKEQLVRIEGKLAELTQQKEEKGFWQRLFQK